jgi:hypothetical protein
LIHSFLPNSVPLGAPSRFCPSSKLSPLHCWSPRDTAAVQLFCLTHAWHMVVLSKYWTTVVLQSRFDSKDNTSTDFCLKTADKGTCVQDTLSLTTSSLEEVIC